MTKTGDSGMQKQILDYLMNQNRPFSANDISGNVLPDSSKTAKTRALEQLVQDGQIKEKLYGKQKVYYVDQAVFGDSKNVDLQSMDAQISELSNTLNALQKQIKSSESALDDLNRSLSTEKAIAELKAVSSEISVLEDKLKKIESKSVRFDANEKKVLCENKEKYLKLFQRRKRLANSVIDAILEGYPKSKKQLLEEIGVETDDAKQ